MTCYYPNNAHIVGVKPDGKKILNFGLPQKSGQEGLLLPCGQCIGCRLERSRQWAIRCVHEAQLYEENCFITLTYNDENLPTDNSLDKQHWVLFMKKFRKKIAPHKIRFFMCGEYGEDQDTTTTKTLGDLTTMQSYSGTTSAIKSPLVNPPPDT